MRTNLLEDLPIEEEGSDEKYRSNRLAPEHMPSTIMEGAESSGDKRVSSHREPRARRGLSLYSFNAMHVLRDAFFFRTKAFDTQFQFFQQPDLQQSLHVHLLSPQTL